MKGSLMNLYYRAVPKLFLPAAFLVLLSCSGSSGPVTDTEVISEPEPMPTEILGEIVNPDQEFSPMRYDDTGLITLNDRCPVRRVALNTAMKAVYVNGRPIGFC